jgi:hypothetical protein
MQSDQQHRTMEQTLQGIQSLDLDPIKFKLMDREEGQGWSRETVERMEIEYKRFLTLLVKHPSEPIAPNKDVDKFWHAHILDTQKYIDDCARIFGRYLHHFPYFGMRGADDAAALANAGRRTKELYAAEFGAEVQGGKEAFCSAGAKAFCSAGSPAFCSAGAAFCSTALDGVSFCSAGKDAQPAFCSSASEAFCSAGAAFCSAGAAFCSAGAAFCSTSGRPIDTATRPSLPPLA